NRLETGQLEAALEPLSLAEVADDAVLRMVRAATAKEQRIETDLADAPIVRGDPALLHQVLQNLLSNAIKYAPLGSAVRVRTFHQDGAGIVTVTDEGPGIAAADMPRLFGRFVRLRTRPTGDEDSTGLGLAIVKRLVEMMNGRVWCESPPGEGATF